jgi:sarcosine oxidase subunit beta
MENTADVIIIGGGIIGNAIAYYLAKKGTDVIVLEGSDHIGNGGYTYLCELFIWKEVLF